MSENLQIVAPGVWQLRLGTPESVTPAALRQCPPCREALAQLPAADAVPLVTAALTWQAGPRGLRMEIPLAERVPAEQFYGLGLQLGRLNQTGRKRTLRVNSDPVGDAGDSHAPVPFVVSTAGYGLCIDTARYVSFYLGSHRKIAGDGGADATPHTVATDTQQLYARREDAGGTLIVDIPAAPGVDIYVFAGPTLRHAVQRYNLFSGGGCLPPLWGLGVWYRLCAKADQEQALALAQALRAAHMPCDVLGLEPGWQTRAYSCSFVWDSARFPDSDKLLADLAALGYHTNLWEHVYVHPSSPLYAALKPYAGDYEVWGGLVPDLSMPAARQAFTDYHRRTFTAHGVSGFKLDECDGSDFIRQSNWSFPEASQFPSGLDGEQMHTLLGLLYQQTINDAFEAGNTRTYSAVRSSGAFAAPLPFVLYSDLYDHRDFVRGVLTSGFSGLLWTPEVRDAGSTEELLRRIQAVVLSPQALINAWYIKNPPWLQYDRARNNADELLPDAAELEEAVRRLFRLRMMLVPYLYAAFARYHFEGLPPFRALVLDYPDDPATHNLDDQYLIGDDLLFAPIFAGQHSRSVYLPAGTWYDLHTHQRYDGGSVREFATTPDTVLLFVRAGTMLPLAEPMDCITGDTVFDLAIHCFGAPAGLRAATLYEDDGVSNDYRRGVYNRVTIRPDQSLTRRGNYPHHRYRISAWQHHA